MKTIVAGSRSITRVPSDERGDILRRAIDEAPFEIGVVVSGTCRGVDQMGEMWAEMNGVPVEHHPADWDTHGKAAGPKRNEEMAEAADALIAVWDGKSSGTKDMIDRAREHGLDVHIHEFSPREGGR